MAKRLVSPKGKPIRARSPVQMRRRSRAGVGHANSQYVCGLSVLIARYRDGTLRYLTSKRCPMRRLGSGDALPGSLFRRYSSDANGRLQLLLYPVLAVRRSCQLSTASSGLPLASLCRQRTIRRTVVWSSRDDGLGNQESGTSETRDLRIDSRQNFLSIHAHGHIKSRAIKVVGSRRPRVIAFGTMARDAG
jgi:hypothetical protein